MSIVDMQKQAVLAENDFEIWAAIKSLSPLQLPVFFDATEDFFVDSDCLELAQAARKSITLADIASGKKAMQKAAEEYGYGVTFKNSTSTLYSMIHTSVNATPRVTYFDERGFVGHAEFNTFDEAVLDSFQSGVKYHAKDTCIDDIIKFNTANVA